MVQLRWNLPYNGWARLVALLLSIATGSLAQLAPRISSVTESTLVTEGDRIDLQCQAEGSVPLQYQWLYNATQPLTQFSSIGTYSIVSARRLQAGHYWCLVRNAHGTAISTPVELSVAYMGEFEQTTHRSIRVQQGKHSVLRPPPLDAAPTEAIRWTWTFQDQPIYTNGTHFVTSTGELVLTSAEMDHSGLYELTASHTQLGTGFGVANSAQTQLHVDVIPSGFSIVPEPRIVYWRPEVAVVKRAQNAQAATLECVVQARRNSDLNVVWTSEAGALIVPSSRYTITNSGQTLSIRNPSAQDEGLYTCTATVAGRQDAQTTMLRVIERPRVARELPATTAVAERTSVRVPCPIEPGANSTVYDWYMNGEKMRTIGLGDSVDLNMPSIQSDQQGVYQCMAVNAAGAAAVQTLVNVKSGSPRLLSSPQNISVSVGQRLQLQCSAAGQPAPDITWRYNGTTISPNDLSYNFGADQSLIIQSVQLNDNGWYTCRARNDQGETEATAFVKVTGASLIVEGPDKQQVIIGSNVLMECKVSPSIGNFVRTWFFNDQLLSPGAARNLEHRADGSLYIKQVGPSRIGTYKCSVTAAGRGTDSAQATLNIIEKPGMPLDVTAELQNETAPAKVLVSWKPGFDGNSPIIKYTVQMRSLGDGVGGFIMNGQAEWSEWDNVVSYIEPSDRQVLVDNLKPSATLQFRVIASNRFGGGMASVQTQSIEMPQQAPAAAPQHVAASARSSESIMVQWQAPPVDQWNGDVLGYICRYRLANYQTIPWNYKNVSDPQARNSLLTSLITWREYEIQLCAYNQRGLGVYSRSVLVTTLEGVPTAPPTGLEVVVLNSTAVSLSFVQPPQQMIPGVNLGYKVEAWPGAVGVDSTEVRRALISPISQERLDFVLAKLAKYETYNVTVLCYTAAGDGPRSQAVEATTDQDVPSAVGNLHFERVLHDSVLVVWNEPAQPNGVLLDYTLSYWLTNDTTSRQTIKTSETSHAVTGLTQKTHYTFEVHAETVVGTGPIQRAQMTSGVPPDLPGAPTNLKCHSSLTARSVLLEFTPGYDGNTIISQWLVEAQVDDSMQWVLVYNTSQPKASSLLVDSLRPFTRYVLRVKAENIVGDSMPSGECGPINTLATLPEHPPADVDAQPTAHDTVLVTWTPLRQRMWNSKPIGYVLAYRALAAAAGGGDGRALLFADAAGSAFSQAHDYFVEIKINAPGDSQYLVEGLLPNRRYEFKMCAVNDIGASNFTQVLAAQTYEHVPSRAPNQLTVQAISPTSVRVTWSPLQPEFANGRVMGYKLTYEPEPLVHTTDRSEHSVAAVDAAVLNGLHAGTNYTVRLAARTIVGLGPYTAPYAVTTPDDLPGPPSEVWFPQVSDSQVRVEWRPPYVKNGYVTQYRISYWLNSTHPSSAVSETRPNDLYMFSVVGILPRNWYAFNISAQTSAGWGPGQQAYVYTTNAKASAVTPGIPFELRRAGMESATSHSLLISWQPAAGQFIQSSTSPTRFYSIQYQQTNGEWLHWPYKSPHMHAKLFDLKPSTNYRFRVRAHNDVGESDWSDVSAWLTTKSAAPDLPPDSLTASPVESTSVKCVWAAPPPQSWNSQHIGFRLVYSVYPAVNDSNQWEYKEVPMRASADLREHTLHNLIKFTHYIVKVQAFNSEGSGPLSRPVFVYVGYSIPDVSLQNVMVNTSLGASSLLLTWRPWDYNTQPIAGIAIRYRALGERDWREELYKQEEPSYRLHQLRPYTVYEVQLLPFNRAGKGPVTKLQAMTQQSAPGPIGQLGFSDILLDSVNVSWAAPESPNGVIRRYRVSYKTYTHGNGFNARRVDVVEYVENSTHWYLATDLEQNATYTFSVAAETSVGYGPDTSKKVRIGPVEGAPSAPSLPDLRASDTSATLSWTHNTSVTGYIIQARRVRALVSPAPVDEKLGKWYKLTSVLSDSQSYTVGFEQLQPNSVYEFRVFARNRQGIGYPSPATESLTTPAVSGVPFYYDWRFLVALVLLALLFFCVVIAVLCYTGKNDKYKYDDESVDSLQFADGAVTYELRARKPLSHQHKDSYQPPRPDPSKLIHAHHAPQPQYDNIAHRGSDVAYDVFGGQALGGRHEQPFMQQSIHSHAHNTQISELSSSEAESEGPVGGGADDPDVGSIVQHYAHTDATYRETWRRARQQAAYANVPNLASTGGRITPSMFNGSQSASAHELAEQAGYGVGQSASGAPSETNSVAGEPLPNKHNTPGFTSFV